MATSSPHRSHHDPRAFGDFYRAHAAAVTRYFARRVVDPEAAHDLAAETFAQAYAGRERFRGATEPEARAWLFTIAQRQLAAYLRQGYVDDATRRRLGLERPDAAPEADAGGEVPERLTRELEGLPAGHRDAVRLRVVDELGYPEVARRLAISEPAARMRVSRALAHLRARLAVALVAAIALLGGAYAVPPTRAAMDDLYDSTLARWFSGAAATAPGRPAAAGEALPDWVAPQQARHGTGVTRVLAEAGGDKLVVLRQGDTITFGVAGFAESTTVADLRRRLAGERIRLLSPGRFNDRHDRRPIFGVVATTVARIQFNYADGTAPVVQEGLDGAFGLTIQTNRRPRSLTGYDATGRLVARLRFDLEPPQRIGFRYCPASGCQRWLDARR